MKRILFYILILSVASASAQQVNNVPDYIFRYQMSVGRNAVTDTAAYMSLGPRYGATKGFQPPMVLDTASFSATKRNGLMIFSVQKNKFLYWDSVGVKWSEMAGTAGSAIAGTLTTNYIPKATSSTTLGNSSLYDSLGFIRGRLNNIGNGDDNRIYQSIIVDGLKGYAMLLQQNDSAQTSAQYVMKVRKGILGTSKPRAGYGAGIEFQMQDDTLGWRRSGFLVTRITDTAAATYKTRMDIMLHNGSNFPVPLIVYADSTIRMAKLAGTGTRNVVVDANGDLSAGSASSGYVLYTDTASMLSNYFRKTDTATMLTNYVRGSGTTNYIPKFNGSRLVGNSTIYDNGTSVGIGTASPNAAYKLDLTNGSDARARQWIANISFVGDNGDVTGFQFRTLGTGHGVKISNGANSTEWARFNSDGELLVNTTTDAGAYALQVAGSIYSTTGAVLAASSGNVGIGTTSPSFKTHISAPRNTTGLFLEFNDRNTAGDYSQIGFGYAPYTVVTSAIRSAADNPYTSFNANLTFHTYNSGLQQRMVINSDGNVGIGTTSPGEKLEVNGNIKTAAPTSGTAKPWRLGEAATVSPTSPNRTIRVEIDGTVYYIHAKTTND